MADYSVLREDLQPGSVVEDFRVVKAIPVSEISGAAYVMEHEPSGARVMWLACADNNKSFSIGFKTPPQDSTGVFHILEHSVLCGSKKYPVKEPFVNLIKSSMATFLNAMTWPDKTVYPVASTSEADLSNLMDVYLEAVFHPNIYTNKHIFEQEGWHLELSEEDELTYNGVVYNEMKGAFSSPDTNLFNIMCAEIYPDNAYRWESGGHPLAIPDLTYEQFLDHHKRHYQLSNSYTLFYGNLDINRHLKHLSEVFAGVPAGEGKPNELVEQDPVVVSKQYVRTGSPDTSCVGLAYVMEAKPERTRHLATAVLIDALMGNNEAPLKKKLLAAGLGKDVDAQLIDELLQPSILFELKGAKEDVAQKFQEIVESCASRLVKRGIDKDLLESALNQLEFAFREADNGYPLGIGMISRVLGTWLYDDDDPISYVRYDEALAFLKENVDTGYFENLLKELILDSKHHGLIDLRFEEGSDRNEREIALQDSLVDLSDKERESIKANVAELRRAQEMPDAPEDLAKLPLLSVSDIEDAPAEPKQRSADTPLPCMYHDIDTHNIDYLYGYFWLDKVLFDQLPYVTILAHLLGRLDTEHYKAEDLAVEINKQLGTLSFFHRTFSDFEDATKVRSAFVAGAATLSDKVDEAARLLPEVLLTTKFDDKDRICNILTQDKVALEEMYVASGHTSVRSRLMSYYRKGSLVEEKMGGIDYYRFICDLLENFDSRFGILKDTLQHLQKSLFVANNCEFSFAGPQDDLEYFWDKAGKLGLSDADGTSQSELVIPEPCVRNEAFTIPGNVCYNGYAQKLSEIDHDKAGAWIIAGRALSFDCLWNEVRVQGGAYGCGFVPGEQIVCSWSYRDPQVDASYNRFKQEPNWLASWEPTEAELTGYIISCVAGLDAPKPFRRTIVEQDRKRFCNVPEGRDAEVRSQLLNCTAEDLKALAPILEEAQSRSAVCTFGNKDMIAKAATDMKVLELIEA